MTPGQFISKWKAAELKESTAAQFVSLTQRLRKRGFEAAEVTHFVNHLVFCMFAEDAGLLNDMIFWRVLKSCTSNQNGAPHTNRDSIMQVIAPVFICAIRGT